MEPTQPRPPSSAESGGNPYAPKPYQKAFTPVPKDARGSARQVGGESADGRRGGGGAGGVSRSGDMDSQEEMTEAREEREEREEREREGGEGRERGEARREREGGEAREREREATVLFVVSFFRK